MRTVFLSLILFLLFACSRDITENSTSESMISVEGKVWDNYTNKPISNLTMYVYKPRSLYSVYKIIAQTKTDNMGRYSMSFKFDYSDYYVSFDKSSNQFIFDSNNLEHFLNQKVNKIDFEIRKAKIFKTNVIILNNTYGSMSLYNGYFTESQTIPFGVTNATMYFKADPLGPNIFQMYVNEVDGHYWWKQELKEYSGNKDTLEIEIKADISTFKRYSQNQNPGS